MRNYQLHLPLVLQEKKLVGPDLNVYSYDMMNHSVTQGIPSKIKQISSLNVRCTCTQVQTHEICFLLFYSHIRFEK